MDVSRLHTNIVPQGGIKKLENALTNTAIKAIKTMMILRMTCNNFIFNSKFFQQIKGTIVRIRATPNYVSISMGASKKKYVYNSKYYQHIRFYCRYMDDLFSL